MTLQGVTAFKDWDYGGKYSPKSHGSTQDLQATFYKGREISRECWLGIQGRKNGKYC